VGGDALGGESVSDSLPCCGQGRECPAAIAALLKLKAFCMDGAIAESNGCGLARGTWNEIGRHIAGTSCLRTMLAAADYGPSPTFAQGFGGQAHAVDSLLSLAANKLLFLESDEVC